MEIYVIFGLPASGKTFVGNVMQKYFGFYHHDGDQDMTQKYIDAILQEQVTDEMREEFFSTLIASIKKLQQQKIVISQTFIKEKFRKQFLQSFPDAKFILVQTQIDTREKRLPSNRFDLSLKKWRKMASIFEIPNITHSIIYNNEDGEENIKKQLQILIK